MRYLARRLAWRMGVAALAGVVAAFGLAPWGLWPLTLLALMTVPALLVSAAGTGQAAWIGWAFGAGYFAHALSWIVEPFLIDIDRHGWMAPFALGFMAGGLALFWALAFAVAWRLARAPGARVLLLVLLWSLAEYGRAYLLTGFPWAALAQVWTDSPALLLLAWIGPQGLALATLAVALPPGLALALARPAVGPGGRVPALLPALLPGLAMGAAVWAAQAVAPDVATTGRVLRLVQPNAPQRQKWDPAWVPIFFQRQLAATAAAPRPDLIVWPEAAVPMLLGDAGDALAAIAAAAAGVPVVLGIQRRDRMRFFNSLVVLDGAGAVAGVYDKHHLVPFGEYVPLGDLAARFGLYGLAAGEGHGYSAGPGPALVSLGRALGRALPLICYEAVFARDVNAAPERPELLLQITNDAWFGTRTGPYQHLAQARMRAVEQGLPLARAANTGISAMIDPLGRVVASLPLGTSGHVDAALPAPLPPTPYARTGDLPLLMLLLVALAGVVWRTRPAPRPRKPH